MRTSMRGSAMFGTGERQWAQAGVCYAGVVTPRKLLAKITASQTNVRFRDLVPVAEALGFKERRVSGVTTFSSIACTSRRS